MPRRLRPTNPIAADAILVGDPGRALMLAQELLENPLMSNHARGLWGYTASTLAGHPLTIQSTGMGGPSAAAVFCDMRRLGMRRAIRVGSCLPLDPALEPGQVLVVERTLAGDGTSRSLLAAHLHTVAGDAPCEGDVEAAASGGVNHADAGDQRRRDEVTGDGELTAALLTAAADIGGRPAVAHSVDLAPGVLAAVGRDPAVDGSGGQTAIDGSDRPAPSQSEVNEPLPAVSDLQTAALLTLGQVLELPVAALLVVEGADDEEERMKLAGRAAAEALSKAQP